MTDDLLSSLENHTFFGEFFFNEEKKEDKFVGKIQYSPESGLTLEYSISNTNIPNKANYLLGILNNGKKCTLIGVFQFACDGAIFCNGKHGFSNLIIGDFVQEDTFGECVFTFTNMQEFFYPKHRMNSIKYENNPIELIAAKDWEIQLEHRAKGKDITRDLANIILADNDARITDITAAFEKIKKDHPNERFYLRDSIEFIFRYKSETAFTPKAIYNEAYKICALFSVLMNKPTFPDMVTLHSSKNITIPLSMISSIALEARTVVLAKKETNNHFLPLKRNDIDLVKALKKWIEIYEENKVLSTTFQYETNFRTLHSAYSDIVLFATHIEDIKNYLKFPNQNKYEGPIRHYGSDLLIEKLENKFSSINSDQLGVNIGHLRDELAHVGRPKKLINKLQLADLCDIGWIMKLIVVSHLLHKLEIDTREIHSYQNNLIQF